MTILDEIKRGKLLLSDGAMGTMLQAAGLQPGECPERWNVLHGDKVKSIAGAYSQAGSNIVETNSFGGTSYKLNHYFKELSPEELADKITEFNVRAAQLAAEGAGPGCFIAGSAGPTGQMLQPYGMETEDDFYQAFKPQIVALEKGGAQAVCIETMSALEEAEIALRAAQENTSLTTIVTFTFEKNTRGEYRTMMGVSPEQMAERFTQAGADIIGSNCGNGIEGMIEICRIIKAHTDRPVMIQANAGLPVLEDGRTIFKATPEVMAGKVGELKAAGANIIGGCCGTTPEHIAAMKAVLA